MIERVSKSAVGNLPTGEPVDAYSLRGEGGVTLRAITLGGIVTHLHVPDAAGRPADVVLGFDGLRGYLGPHPFFGAIAGRVAGRISGARFVLDGTVYPLEANDSPNHLHGGSLGFDKQLWAATPTARADGAPSLRLHRVSPDGEAGYPGEVRVAVTYTVSADNRFIMDVEATSENATPLSVTQHSYFNLAGAGTVERHELQVFARYAAAVDGAFTLLGRREPVAGRPGDLRAPGRRLGDVLPQLQDRHGDLYFVNRDSPGALATAARLVEPTSGRVLTVRTSEDCLQIYTGAKLDGTLIGKAGRHYGPHAGLCLECEGYPDGANSPELGDIILRPGHAMRRTTEYAFSNL